MDIVPNSEETTANETDEVETGEVVTKSSGLHSGNLLSSLMKLRSDDSFCDITIICGDFKMKAHKNVLASATDYFKAMFLNETKEATSGVVDFSKMSQEVVKQSIGFIYSGSVDISLKTARGLLDASEMMQLTELSKLCVEFLAERVDMESCAEVIRFSNIYHKDALNEPIRQFLRQRFEEFSHSNDFTSFDFQDLFYCLSLYENFDESCEKLKWKSILTWVNVACEERKCHFPDLFKTLNIRCLSKSFLREICQEKLVDDSMICLRAIRDVFVGNIDRPVPSRKSNEVSHMVSVVKDDGVIVVGTLSSISAAKFGKIINLDMDVICHNEKIFVGTGLKIYEFANKTWTCREVDITKVQENPICFTCPKCFRDHFYRGDCENIAKMNNKTWSSQSMEKESKRFYSRYNCIGCSSKFGKSHPNDSCYNRCIGGDGSVYMLTRNYVIECCISASGVIHHNVSIGLGNGFCVASSNLTVYALGGNGTEYSAVAFDLVTCSITILSPMRTSMTFAHAYFLDEILYVSDKDMSVDMECYNFKSKTWCRSYKKMFPPPQSIHFGDDLGHLMQQVY